MCVSRRVVAAEMTSDDWDPGEGCPQSGDHSHMHALQTAYAPSSMVSSFFRKRCFAFCGTDRTASDKSVTVCAGLV